MIHTNDDGWSHAKALIGHGKVSHKAFAFDDDDERALLGPEGTDLENHRRHHLGIDDERPQASPKRHRYPFAKDGHVYTRALHGIRNAAHEAGHEGIRDAASNLLGEIKSRMMPDERAGEVDAETRHIVKDGGKYLLYTKDGHKLISKHDTHEEAVKREQAKKAHDADEAHGRSIVPAREVRSILTEVRVKETEQGPVIHGYGAVYNQTSEPIPTKEGRTFQERIHPRAFEKLLATNPDVRALGNHDPNMLLGRTKSGTMTLGSDDRGLHYEIRPSGSAIGDHFLKAIQRGDMDGSSFSFNAAPGGEQWDHTTTPPTRTITEMRDLFDVGPVTFPAYVDAGVAARSMSTSLAVCPRLQLQRQAHQGAFPVPSVPQRISTNGGQSR